MVCVSLRVSWSHTEMGTKLKTKQTHFESSGFSFVGVFCCLENTKGFLNALFYF